VNRLSELGYRCEKWPSGFDRLKRARDRVESLQMASLSWRHDPLVRAVVPAVPDLVCTYMTEMALEHGLFIHPSCIWRWVQIYGPELDRRCRVHLKPTNKPCGHRPTQSLAVHSSVGQTRPSPFLQYLPFEGGKHREHGSHRSPCRCRHEMALRPLPTAGLKLQAGSNSGTGQYHSWRQTASPFRAVINRARAAG
jgi:hypothetical protein